MGGFCCNCNPCICPEVFSIETIDFTWLTKDFSLSPLPGEPAEDACSRLAVNCVVDSTWAVYYDETVIGPWVPRVPLQIGSEDCSCSGTYVRKKIQIDDQIIQRFKMWVKRRTAVSVSIVECGVSQFKIVVVATVQYLWIWNSTVKTRNRYTETTRFCPMNTTNTDPPVVYGDDAGLEPPFPPDDDFPEAVGCPAESWTPADTCNSDTRAIVNFTGRNTSCFDETRSANLGVVTNCSDCTSILVPDPDRTVSSGAVVTYESECISCGSIPETIELAIPDQETDISFSVYGGAFSTGLCTWLTAFPTSPTLTIPRLLTITLTV